MQSHSEASPDVAAIEEVKIATFISTKKKKTLLSDELFYLLWRRYILN